MLHVYFNLIIITTVRQIRTQYSDNIVIKTEHSTRLDKILPISHARIRRRIQNDTNTQQRVDGQLWCTILMRITMLCSHNRNCNYKATQASTSLDNCFHSPDLNYGIFQVFSLHRFREKASEIFLFAVKTENSILNWSLLISTSILEVKRCCEWI